MHTLCKQNNEIPSDTAHPNIHTCIGLFVAQAGSGILTPLRYLRNVSPPDHTAPPLQLSGSIGMDSTFPKSFIAEAYNATASTIKAFADWNRRKLDQ